MTLTCPSCGARFRIAPEQLGPAGRRVRCGDCRHTWHQQPVAEAVAAEQAGARAAAEPFAPGAAPAEPAPPKAAAPKAAAPKAAAEAPPPTEAETEPEPAPEPAAPPPTEAEPEPGPAVAAAPEPAAAEAAERVSRRAFAKPARPQPKRPRFTLAAGWALYVVVVVALAAGFYFGRAPLVAMAPGMARLYDLVGIEDEAVELGLELRDVKSVRRLIDGERVVVIEGRVVNLSGADRQVPPLRASVTDAEGEELDRWTFRAERARLAPGGSTGFETVAKNPPREGNLSIDFVIEN